MTTLTTNEQRKKVGKSFLILHEEDRNLINGDVSAVDFLMFPSTKYQNNVVKLIQSEGGSVQDFQKNLMQDHTIVLINMTAVCKDPEAFLQKDVGFPNDAFDMQLVLDYLKNPDIDMVNYRITPTIYQAYDPKDVMLQNTSWSNISKIMPRLYRPHPKTLQELLAEANDSSSEEEFANETIVSARHLFAASTSVKKPEGNKNPRPLVDIGEPRDYPVLQDSRSRLRVFANHPCSSKKFHPTEKSSYDELFKDEDSARDVDKVDLEPFPKRCRIIDSSIPLYSSDEDVSHSESTASTTQRTNYFRVIGEKRGKPADRVPFSKEEGQRMLNLVVKNGWIKHVKGRALWKFIVSEYLLEAFTNIHHPWESLWQHMRKKVMGSITAGNNRYQVTRENRKALMSVYDSKVMNDPFKPPLVDSVKGINLQAVKTFKEQKLETSCMKN